MLRISIPKKANESHVFLCLSELGFSAPVRVIERQGFVLALMPDHETLELVWNAGRDELIVPMAGKPASEVRAMDKEIERDLHVRRRVKKKMELAEKKQNYSDGKRSCDERTLLLFGLPPGCSVEDIADLFKQMNLAVKRVNINPKRTTAFVEFDDMALAEKAWFCGRSRQISVKNTTLQTRIADDITEARLDHGWNLRAIKNK